MGQTVKSDCEIPIPNSPSVFPHLYYLDAGIAVTVASMQRAVRWRYRSSGLVLVQSDIGMANSMNWNSIYVLVKKIPRGRVMTYGAVARVLKLRGSARSAGRAMAACPSGKAIPWHRVVGAGGRLLIREPHASLQRKLLESEGVRVLEKRVADFPARQWESGKKPGKKGPKTARPKSGRPLQMPRARTVL